MGACFTVAKKKQSKDTTDDLVEEKLEASEDDPVTSEDTVTEAHAEETIVDDAEEHAHQMVEEEHAESGSLASKVLTGLVLLIAGGALALWGGPKLVPYLPSGMAPVAQFFSPGDFSGKEDVAALQTEISDLRAKLDQTVQASDLADVQQATETALVGIQDKLNATDGEAIEARLAEVETKLSGLAAQMGSLTESLSGVQASTEGLSVEASGQIAAYKAQIEGLMAEIETLSSQQGSLAQKIDDVSVVSERKVAEAEEMVATVTEEAATQVATAEIQKGLATLAKALESGSDLSEPLGLLSSAGLEVPAELSGFADTGIPTLATLKTQFSASAHQALKASIKANAEDGLGSKLGSFLRSQVTVRSLEPKEGTDTDAILSRMQGNLDNDALEAAVSEAAALGAEPKEALAGWLDSAKNRLGALGALSDLQSQFGS